MRILVTGAKGFIGKNLVSELKNRGTAEILEFDKENTADDLEQFVSTCDFVFHLAGINRPKNEKEFFQGNVDFTNELLSGLLRNKNKSPVVYSSSIQSALDNPYGKSKLLAEKSLLKYSQETGIPVAVYRLPNVFGKWCRPSYNSVVATFCHNIARELPIRINDKNATLYLVYIDDVLKTFLDKKDSIINNTGPEIIENIEPVYHVKLGHLAESIYSFRDNRTRLEVPDFSDAFTRKLYSTYMSFLPENQFSYPLSMITDNRGSFTEFLRTKEKGQFSVNIIKPGVVKGNHWHHSKNEKFVVIRGEGMIRFRKIGRSEVIEYPVSGENMEVVDIPAGYTHNIENLREMDLIAIIWASDVFDTMNPDTWYEKV